ncbi:MAG: GNAT family N-acetyltransferase [Proteobacteria bacterium]|nr:GNAT family N-acetyltransferase [Pseudomonadota bacterium]
MNTDNITIRRLHIDELDDIQALYAEQIKCDDNPLTAIRIPPKQHAWEMRRLRQQLIASQRYIACLALDEHAESPRIVGYAAAILETQAHLFEVESYASLEELWVIPDYRGRGIGQALMETLFCALDDLGISWITTHFPESATEIHDFFKKIGFEQKTIEMQLHLKTDA